MKKYLLPLLIATFFCGLTSKASAQQDGFLGEVRMFAGNFAPRGWAFCDGQELAISPNTALFSILGTTHGGDGRTTFCLPDLRDRAPVHPGKATSDFLGRGLGTPKTGVKVTRSGGDESDPNTQSTIRINFIICTVGSFPSRS